MLETQRSAHDWSLRKNLTTPLSINKKKVCNLFAFFDNIHSSYFSEHCVVKKNSSLKPKKKKKYIFIYFLSWSNISGIIYQDESISQERNYLCQVTI